MNKVRRSLAVIALVATLSGLSLQGIGASSLATMVANQHSHTISASQSAKQVAFKIHPPCPTGGVNDC